MIQSPLILEGPVVRLEPLADRHVPALMAIAQASPGSFLLTNTPLDDAQRDSYFERAFRDRASGVAYPFVIVLRADGQVVGTTRFNAIDAHERRCDIGFTWMDPAYHGRRVNREAKLLMLTYAFETLRVNRVQFQADERNLRSCRALERLGATREGVLRMHSLARDGLPRNSAIYSIIVSEWPAVKARLTAELGEQAGATAMDQATRIHSAERTLEAIRAAERGMRGRLGVAAFRLDGNDADAILYRHDEPYRAASTIKVFVLLTILEAVAQGRLELDREIVLRPDDQVMGSGVLKSMTSGRAFTVRDLALLMIIVSDNTATNLLIGLAGVDAVNASLQAHGWRETRLAGLLQKPDAPAGGETAWSTTSPRDLADHFRRLWRGELLPAALTEVARGIYLRQEYTGTLGRYLPYDADDAEEGLSSLLIASKSGWVRGVRNDAGVIRGAHGAYALAVMTSGCPDRRVHLDNLGDLAIAQVSRELYRHFGGDLSGGGAVG